MTPRLRSSSVSDVSLAYAPRSLKAPTGWRFSGFNQVVSSQGRSGVWRATPAMRSAAARIRSSVTSWGRSATTELIELVRVLLEMAHHETLHDVGGRHHTAGRMEAARLPRLGGEGVELLHGGADAVGHSPQERCRIRVTVALDRGDAPRIGLGPPERDRLGVSGGSALQDLPDLPQPVLGKLGEVSPDLAGLPALGPARVRIGQAGWQTRGGVRLEPLLDSPQASQGIHVATHDGRVTERGARDAPPPSGRSTIGEVNVPRRSTASVTVSPGSR